METMQLNNDIKKINDEVAILIQAKGDTEKILQDKKVELQNLLANEALGKNQKKIEPLRQEIANFEKDLQRIIDTLAGLTMQKGQAEQGLKDSTVSRLTQELHEIDSDVLLKLKEKLFLLQKIVDLESQIEQVFDEVQQKKAELSCLGAPAIMGMDFIPLNIWGMNIKHELVGKFLPLDDRGLKEEIDHIDKILKEVNNG